MILSLFSSVLFAGLSLVFGLFPTISLPDGISSAFVTLFGLLASIGYFVDLSVFSSVLIFCFAMYKLEFIVDVFHYFLRKIPGIS